MKKIMFNDKYGLTQAVLEGRKTMTRREIKCPRTFNGIEVNGFRIAHNANGDWYTYLVDNDERDIDGSYLKPTYQVGEVVAIAQCYKDTLAGLYHTEGELYDKVRMYAVSAGYYNKMFVKSELMPHHIRITNVRVERLQDISDEDCLREGIMPYKDTCEYYYTSCNAKKDIDYRNIFPKGAFASLIDKVSGKGTWESNPWVFVYEFEKVD